MQKQSILLARLASRKMKFLHALLPLYHNLVFAVRNSKSRRRKRRRRIPSLSSGKKYFMEAKL